MKIGVFDSGLGGLFLLKNIAKQLPQYDYLYLGDTLRMPYGNRSQKAIYQFTKEGVDHLFKHNCQIIILACNTASTRALRKIQQDYLPKNYPDRRVLGVIIPTAEVATENSNIARVGVLATSATVAAKSFTKELKKLNKHMVVYEQAAPLLVPLIENNALKFAHPILAAYLKKLLKHKLDVIILGCTHYPILKKEIRKIAGKNITVISQDELLPGKLELYLKRHPEINKKLGKRGKLEIQLTDLTEFYIKLTKRWFKSRAKPKLVTI